MVTGSVSYTNILLKQMTNEWWKAPPSNFIGPTILEFPSIHFGDKNADVV